MSSIGFLRQRPFRRFDALLIYLILEGASSLFLQLMVTIYVVYWTTIARLDPLQIMLAAAVFEGTIFLCEIPTGVVADVYSRRLSIIIGVCLAGLALLIEGFLPVFGAILIAEVISGLGATFLSGATQAWIADEIGESRAGAAFMRAAQVRTLCAMAGIGVSVALASIDLRLPVIAGGTLLLCLALFLVLFMPETGFQRAPHADRSTWSSMVTNLRAGLRLVRVRRALMLILAIEVIFAVHSEGFDQLWQAHFLQNFTLPPLGSLNPVVWFGILSVGANALNVVMIEGVRRRVNLGSHAATARLLMALYGFAALGILVFSNASSFFVAMVAYWCVTSLRGVARPVNEAWLNQNVEPRVRATMFSMLGQVGAVGEIAGGPPVGALATRVSLRAALAVGGVILTLTLPLLAAALRQKPDEAFSGN
jgi:DHA3 family tetracycline resistance protein-like MFS transporter